MRLEVIDFNNLSKIFEYNLTNEERTRLNKILISNKYNDIEKRYIFFIVNFLKENTYIDEKLVTNFLIEFLDFILDIEIYNKLELYIIDLLYSICTRINEANDKVKLNESTIETLIIKRNSVLTNEVLEVDDIDRLKLKINAINKVASNIINVNDKKYNELLNRILLSNINANNYHLIVKLFDNTKISDYANKREIIFNYLLNNKVDNINNQVLDILSNEEILKIGDDKYKELVLITFASNEKEILIYNSIINNRHLSLDRKVILIDYLKNMLVKVKNTYCLDKVLREKLNVFNVVYSSYFNSLNDDEFKNTLDKILLSNKPMSYIKVLVYKELDDDKKDYALTLINEGKVIKNDNRATDYMEYVSLSAISPLLKELDNNEYKKILDIINKCSNSFYDLIKERDKDKNILIDDRIILNDIAKCITSMLYKKDLYINNMDRFYYTVELLLNVKRSYYNEIVSFATNDNSKYYTDIEYKRILKLIERAYNNDRLYDYYMNSRSLYTDGDYIKRNKLISSLDGREGSMLVVDLFTNNNIVFMEDKNILFEIAENGDKVSIIKLINELNRQGNYTRNLNSILTEVDENTYRVFMPGIKKIKEKVS